MSNSMIGYIDNQDNVIAVEHGWNLGHPKDLGRFLNSKFPTKEDAKNIVNGGIVVVNEEPQAYQYVDGYGDVICERLAMDKTLHRPHIEYLYLFMKGSWQVSDNGIDWESVENFIEWEEQIEKRRLERNLRKVIA